MKLFKKITSLAIAMACLVCAIPASTLSATAAGGSPLCVTADEWTALFDRRNQNSTWLGADGIYSVAINGNDAFGSATEDTKTFFIFSDSLMGTSDASGNVTWAPGQPSQTSAVLTGNVADSDNIKFVWGKGGNGQFGWQSHLFGEHKWMLDCFVVNDAIYILGFPEENWKPKQMDMIKIPIVNGEPDYAHYSKTSNITQLNYHDSNDRYLYSYGIGVMSNTVSAGAPNPDGYIYFYGYRDAKQEFSRKDLIVSRIKESDFPDFSKLRYWNGNEWVTNIEESAPLIQSVSCEMSVTPITEGPSAGKYIAIYTENTESANIKYAIGDSPVGPFDAPVTFYVTPEHGLDDGGMYTYNAKAHPHLSSDGRLLVSYNCNNRNTFGRQKTYEYHPRFLWLDLNGITSDEPERNENLALNGIASADSVSSTYGGVAANINDGDPHTRWQSNSAGSSANAPAWLQIELDAEYSIEVVDVYWEAARPSQGGMKVEISNDGTNWNAASVTIAQRVESSVAKPDGSGSDTLYKDAITLLGAPTAKFVRITITGMDAGKEFPSCWEMEIYGKANAAGPEGGITSDRSVSHTVAQLSNNSNDVRFIAAVDSLNYSNIGFIVTATDNNNIGAQTEYFIDNRVFSSVGDVSSQPFGIENGYVFSLVINAVPDGARFVVKPFAEKEDGTRVYGEMRIVSVSGDELTVV